MIRVLILAYDFPPYHSVGAMRPDSWFRCFWQRGIYPVVCTRHWDADVQDPVDHIRPSGEQQTAITEGEYGTVIRVPFRPNVRDRLILKHGLNKGVVQRKALTAVLTFLKFLFFIGDNTQNIHEEAAAYLSRHHCDVIIATGEPFVLFRYAALLSKRFQIPWVADYRDGWSTDLNNRARSILDRLFVRCYFEPVEKHWLRHVAHITTAAPSYKRHLQRLFPKKSIEVIYNGYDEKALAGVLRQPQNRKVFEVAYAGSLHAHQRVDVFLKGFRQFQEATKATDVQLTFYGIEFYPEQVKRLLQYEPAVQAFIKTTPRLPYREVLEKMQRAHVLLLLSDEGMDWLNAKIFDYFALQRKILLVKNDRGILAQLMDECNGGVKCSTAEEVKAALQQLYLQFQETGAIAHQPEGYAFYSRQTQAARLVDLLKSVVAKK